MYNGTLLMQTCLPLEDLGILGSEIGPREVGRNTTRE